VLNRGFLTLEIRFLGYWIKEILKAKFLTKGKKLPEKSHRVGTSCLNSVKLRLSIVKAVRNCGDKLTDSKMYQGGPVGIGVLAVNISEDRETVEDMYEPYLIQIGFIKRTVRRREATAAAYQHFGYER
jgi:hypothetical protein